MVSRVYSKLMPWTIATIEPSKGRKNQFRGHSTILFALKSSRTFNGFFPLDGIGTICVADQSITIFARASSGALLHGTLWSHHNSAGFIVWSDGWTVE
jgi:hypothetical protein